MRHTTTMASLYISVFYMRKRDNLKYDISGLTVNVLLAIVSRLPHRTVYTDVLQQAIER